MNEHDPRDGTPSPSPPADGARPLAWARRRPWAVALALATGTLLLYSKVAGYGFIRFDDTRYLTENLVVQRGLTWEGLAWAFGSVHASNWHPLTWLSHMLDVELFGMDPGAHHAVNAVLHAANAALLLVALARLTGAVGRSALVAALFAVHPLHVESVAWIAERKDVLSTMFGVLALLAWSSWVARPRARTYAAVLVLFALSLLAKPMWVTLPCVLLLLDAWPLQRLAALPAADPEVPARSRIPLRRALLEKLPLLALAAASCAVTVFAQDRGGAIAGLEFPLRPRVTNALVAYVEYLEKTFWPSSLAVFYPHPGDRPAYVVAAAALLLAAISAAAWLARRRAPWVAVGWCWFLGTLVPVIGVVQVGAQALADRYSYLPLVGIFVAIAWTGRLVAPRLGPPLAAAAVAVLTSLASGQISHWESNETLFRHALAVTTDNALAHGALADGLRADRGREREALEHAREAVRLEPNVARHWNNLAVTSVDAGLLPEARAAAQRAIDLNPQYVLAWSALGIVEQEAGDVGAATLAFTRAAELAPADPATRFKLGTTLLRAGRFDEATAAFRETVRLAPDHFGAWTNLAVACQQLGRTDEAGEAFVAATRADPRSAGGWRNLGIHLARVGRAPEALRAFDAALRLDPANADLLRRVGALQLGLGAQADALATAARLEAIDPSGAAQLRAAAGGR